MSTINAVIITFEITPSGGGMPGDRIADQIALQDAIRDYFSWNISDADGNELLAGGAPYAGCLGNCDNIVFGCTDDTACNYDNTAESDDHQVPCAES